MIPFLGELKDTIRKDFNSTHILPSEEVDAAPDCPPPHCPIEQSFAVVQSALSITIQIDPPENSLMVYMTPPSNYPSDNTPSPSYSPSSPALSVSPHTPPSINVHSTGVSYALDASPHLPPDDYMDPSNQASSQAHIPLVANGDEAMQVHH